MRVLKIIFCSLSLIIFTPVLFADIYESTDEQPSPIGVQTDVQTDDYANRNSLAPVVDQPSVVIGPGYVNPNYVTPGYVNVEPGYAYGYSGYGVNAYGAYGYGPNTMYHNDQLEHYNSDAASEAREMYNNQQMREAERGGGVPHPVEPVGPGHFGGNGGHFGGGGHGGGHGGR